MTLAQEGPEHELAPLVAPPADSQVLPSPESRRSDWYHHLFDHLFDAETRQPTVVGHGAIAAALLSAAAVVSLALFGYASQRQQEWLSLEGFKKTEPQIKAL
ncbi:MAG TPA: hypothetical protein V6D06_17115, partial [Trichocoleus sp.]